MAIDHEKEELVEFRKALHNFPGRRPCFQTGYRWARTGVLLGDGTRVILDTMTIGGIRYTSTEAVKRFIDAQNKTPETEKRQTKEKRSARSEAAKRELAKMGIPSG